MQATELLQQLGLNKYEAEAYYTLLAQGPLTGYELGKRSEVPLSRSYEVLERLTQKGLALVQPGEPPHYQAADPTSYLGQVRSTLTETLDTLLSLLLALATPKRSNEFWVARGRQAILARAQSLIEQAEQKLTLCLGPDHEAVGLEISKQVQKRGGQVFYSSEALIALLIDEREGLLGTLEPAEGCQAVISANPALVMLLNAYFAQQQQPVAAIAASTQPEERLSWLAWEERKQRRLWTHNRVA